MSIDRIDTPSPLPKIPESGGPESPWESNSQSVQNLPSSTKSIDTQARLKDLEAGYGSTSGGAINWDSRVDNLQQRLNLSDDQAAQLKTSLPAAQSRQEVKEAFDKVLTPEQKETFHKMHHHHHGGHHHRLEGDDPNADGSQVPLADGKVAGVSTPLNISDAQALTDPQRQNTDNL